MSNLTVPPDHPLIAAAGLPLPIYLTNDLTPLLRPVAGDVTSRTFVCSLPKAGTYLVSELLRRLGSEPVGVHVSPDSSSDYRFASRREAREEYAQFTRQVPIERLLTLISRGQHAVGHLHRTPRVVAALADFRVVFVYRDLRDAAVSWMRFHADTRREEKWNWIWDRHPGPREQMLAFTETAGEMFIGMCHGMTDWLADSTAFPLRFETLLGDAGGEERLSLCRRLAAYLGSGRTDSELEVALNGLTSATTLTSTGSRTSRDEYWSEGTEAVFQSLGGGSLNRAFGYE